MSKTPDFIVLNRVWLARQLRQKRIEAGFDQKSFAALIDIDPANLCRIEQGKYAFSVDIFMKYISYLHIDIKLEDLPW